MIAHMTPPPESRTSGETLSNCSDFSIQPVLWDLVGHDSVGIS